MTTYYLSTYKMTIAVDTNAEGVITKTAPIVSKFRWQHIDNLRAWLIKKGGYREIVI